MMKRFLACFLTLALLLSSAALADGHLTFTTTLIETGSVDNYCDDAVFHWLCDRFDIDFEVWITNWDNWYEKDRVWINGGTMPDMMMWSELNYTEYLSYVDQGLIAPLPDGWEETYPNLYQLELASGCYEQLKVDGKTYALPRTTLYLFPPISSAFDHSTVYYRADWAKELGFEFGVTTKISEFRKFLKACIDKDMAGNSATIGMTGMPNKVIAMVNKCHQSIDSGFVKENGKYVTTFDKEGVTDSIKEAREMYKEGLIDPDFYLNQTNDGKSKFANNLAAALVEDGPCTHFTYRKSEFMAANPEVGSDEVWDHIGSTVLTGDDGLWYGTVDTNYWTASIFNPDIKEETMTRILELMDFCCTKEAQEVIALGIPEVDWTTDADGSYVILRAPNEDGTYPDIKTLYPSIYFWYVFTLLADSFTFVDPTLDPYIRETVTAQYAAREEQGSYLPLDMAYNFYASDAKSQYSVNWTEETMRLVLDDSLDIDTEWAKFIEENRAMWEPLLNELNENLAD